MGRTLHVGHAAALTILEGDCLRVLRDMATSTVEAVITDPPFGIGKNYASGREAFKSPEEYWAWLQPRHAQIMRVLRPGGFFAMWQTQLYFRHFWAWFGPDIHIYASAKNFVQLRPTPIQYAYDPIVMFYKPGAEPLRPARPARNHDFFVANTARFVTQTNALARLHPYPRPIDQAVELVRNFSLPGGVVLDPFMGSGTTGIACLAEGRRFIGIEVEPRYIALAEARAARFTEELP